MLKGERERKRKRERERERERKRKRLGGGGGKQTDKQKIETGELVMREIEGSSRKESLIN